MQKHLLHYLALFVCLQRSAWSLGRAANVAQTMQAFPSAMHAPSSPRTLSADIMVLANPTFLSRAPVRWPARFLRHLSPGVLAMEPGLPLPTHRCRSLMSSPPCCPGPLPSDEECFISAFLPTGLPDHHNTTQVDGVEEKGAVDSPGAVRCTFPVPVGMYQALCACHT